MGKDWRDITIGPDANVRQAWEVLDRGAMQIALVVDHTGHLAGTVTDGDIRRAVLHGKGLETPITEVMNGNPTTGLAEETRDSWQRTMHRHSLRHLPILDTQGCVVDLVRYSMPLEPERSTPVVIMAGGLGTRLRPLTELTPKPMIPVGPKPVLETIIENFADQGFVDIYLCLNYKGEIIRAHFGDGRRFGVRITYLQEDRRLGTAGALSLLPQRPREPVIVMNGDLLTKVDFVRLLDFHHQQGFVATMAMREHQQQVPYGVLKIGDGYVVNELVEKPVERYYVNAGIYILDPQTLDLVPDQKFYDMPTLFNSLMEQGRKVGGFPLRDYWVDIGRMEDLERASAEFTEMFG
ncbi:MAG: nucleotidyltransferase family protein [Gammaproteobacteria bacterium]|nr:nucleotidyltransferase family protein [Gammaproteobacteria bacterium]